LTKQPPNTLWCVDFKGEFKLGNGRRCYPLTVSDHASRYLLLYEAFESTREAPVIEAFRRLFRDRGLPVAIGAANGTAGNRFRRRHISVCAIRVVPGGRPRDRLPGSGAGGPPSSPAAQLS
jgi:transposase InsO family protein